MHECPCNRTRARIEIFVRTPDREIDVPIMKRQRRVANRMGEIEARDNSAVLRRSGNLFDIK